MASREGAIRQATRADADAIAAIHARSWRATYRGLLSDDYLERDIDADRERVWRDRFDRLTSDTFAVFLAEDAHVAVGFACVMLDQSIPNALVENLHVVPDRQGQGFGRRLLAEAARWVVTRAPTASLYLFVMERNVDARRFYKSLRAVEHAGYEREMPDGTRHPSIRCEWADPGILFREPP
jgi:GNAT superfamily N-acetyltransferase